MNFPSAAALFAACPSRGCCISPPSITISPRAGTAIIPCLGTLDAKKFCRRHGLSKVDTNLVAWLVDHHLVMSLTAQKKDIDDPEVIEEFARQMGDERHLDCLYLLTVADIRATNPKLWNTWRAALLWKLYHPDWAGLQAVGRVESTRIIGDQISTECRYFLCSFPTRDRFAATVRGHWGIENQQHWVLDVQFSEDACRTRKNHSAENLALMRRLALNLLTHNGLPRDSIRRRKRRAVLNDEYRLRLLFGTPTPVTT